MKAKHSQRLAAAGQGGAGQTLLDERWQCHVARLSCWHATAVFNTAFKHAHGVKLGCMPATAATSVLTACLNVVLCSPPSAAAATAPAPAAAAAPVPAAAADVSTAAGAAAAAPAAAAPGWAGTAGAAAVCAARGAAAATTAAAAATATTGGSIHRHLVTWSSGAIYVQLCPMQNLESRIAESLACIAIEGPVLDTDACRVIWEAQACGLAGGNCWPWCHMQQARRGTSPWLSAMCLRRCPGAELQARAQASVVWEGDLMLSERAAKGPSVGLARVRAVAQQHIWSPGQPLV
jgi:hypothetical protein